MGRSRVVCGLLMSIMSLGFSSVVSAAAIANGGFEAQSGSLGTATCDSFAVTGWNTTNDLCSAGYYNAAPPEGRVFAIIGGGTDFGGGFLSQTISGLNVGDSYTVSFDLGGENFTSSGTEQVMVSMLSGSSTGSHTYDAPHSTGNGTGNNLWNNWSLFTYSFSASATSATIKFMNVGGTGNDTGIDNVSIADTTPGSVPEPGSLVLLCAGAGSLTLLRYRNRQRRSS